jgi:hypothetical protein
MSSVPPFKDLGNIVFGFPKLQSGQFILSEAQLRAMFTTPITLLTAIPNVARIPDFLDIFREAGTTYTVAGIANFQLKVGTVTYIGIAGSDFLGGPGPFRSVNVGVGNSSTRNTDFIVKTNAFDLTNTAVTVNFQSANPSGGSGRVFLTMFWRDWPLALMTGF